MLKSLYESEDRSDMSRRVIRKTNFGRAILQGPLVSLLIRTVVRTRLAVFDHSQTRHTRRVSPIHLKVETCRNIAWCLSTTANSL